MNRLLENHDKIAKFQTSFRGVFTLSDLKNLIAAANPVDFYRRLKDLEKNKILFCFTRGLYVCPGFDLEVASQRLCDKSYVSLANVLARELLIGTVPNQTVYAVKLGKTRTYRTPFGTVVHMGISPRFFFGFQTQNGVRVADKEKAFLDTLYFYQKGRKPYFNVYRDIRLNALDRGKIRKYLKPYKNPRFLKFVKGLLHA